MMSAYMGFIITRTLPAMYVYGIYRHAPSYWNDSMRFRIIVYTHIPMATGFMQVGGIKAIDIANYFYHLSMGPDSLVTHFRHFTW